MGSCEFGGEVATLFVIPSVVEESPRSRQATTLMLSCRVGDPSLPLRMTEGAQDDSCCGVAHSSLEPIRTQSAAISPCPRPCKENRGCPTRIRTAPIYG